MSERVYENYDDYYSNFIHEKKKSFELSLNKWKEENDFTEIINVEYALDETPQLLSKIQFYNQLEDSLSGKAFLENMKLFMKKCNYNYTIDKIEACDHDKTSNNLNNNDNKTNEEEIETLNKYYNNLEIINTEILKELKKKQSKDLANKEEIHTIQKYYFMTYFSDFNPEIFDKIYRDNYSVHIIRNLYAEKNKTILDVMNKDLAYANNYAEFIHHSSNKLYHIRNCNKLLNIDHSNMEVDYISINDFTKIKNYVKKNIKDIQIAFKITCQRDIDIIKNMYSKWSGTIIKCIEKGKQKRPDYYKIQIPKLYKSLYGHLKLQEQPLLLQNKCYIDLND